MPEWQFERGIGEDRAVLVEDGEILEARIAIHGATAAGTILAAQLIQVGQAGRNAIARGDDGAEYLLPHAPRGISQGASLNIEVVRSAIPGAEPWKRPLARASGEAPRTCSLAERLGESVRELQFPNAGHDELRDAGWDDLIEQAASGIVEFPGGRLRISPTPAMILIDVDGTLDPAALAVAGAVEAARAIRRLDIGGSIGIDLPTVAGKGPRQAAAAAIDEWLPAPFERTAVNGFGFVQIVRPRSRPSLLEIWSDRARAEARALLRRVALAEPGARCLVAHPALIAVLESESKWIEALARQTGGQVGLRSDPALAMSAGHAEQV